MVHTTTQHCIRNFTSTTTHIVHSLLADANTTTNMGSANPILQRGNLHKHEGNCAPLVQTQSSTQPPSCGCGQTEFGFLDLRKWVTILRYCTLNENVKRRSGRVVGAEWYCDQTNQYFMSEQKRAKNPISLIIISTLRVTLYIK